MNDTPDHRLRETSWRRPLTAAEQAELRAWLAAHPEARADWEIEAGLSAALHRLPDPPVPSNFTTRVLRAIEREGAAERQRVAAWRSWTWRGWLSRTATAAAVVVLIMVGTQVHQAVYRARLGHSMVVASSVAAAPSPDSLADFEPIQRLSRSPGADTELLSLLQ
jgi:anti-sigma factor RsiW